MERDDFYKMAIEPSFPNEMIFQFTASDPHPDRTLSKEGFDAIGEQITTFAMARSLAYHNVTAKAVKKMRIHVSIEMSESPDAFGDLDEAGPPWYDLNDPSFLHVDGSHRVRGLDRTAGE